MGKKFFTFSVVITTIMWSVGVAALVPSVANGAVCPTLAAGDMIKVTGKPAIYAVNNDLKVLYFPSGDEFKSWRPTYGGYISITQECFDSLSVPSTYPAAVNYHPGSYVVKRPSSDQLYVVEPNNTLAKITSAAATALYGAGYTVMTVSDVFWPHYVNRGADITTAVAHPGMLVSNGGVTYYVDTDNSLRTVDSAGMTANGFQTRFARAVASSAIAGLSAGTAIAAEVPALTDKTQSGGVVAATIPVTPVAGTVSVALSANSPSAGSVVVLAENVPYSKATFTAGSDADVKVNSVVIGRQGLGSVSDFSSVTLYDGATKLGSTRTTWDSDDTITYNIPNGWTITKGTSKELTIVGKLASGKSGTYNALGINSVSLSAGTASGLPVYGNQMTGVTVSNIGSVTIDNQGAAALTKKIGSADVLLAGFQLTLDDYQAGKLNKITLKNQAATLNASDGDLANITLWNGSTKLAGPVSMVNDKITFVLDTPFAIARNRNADFLVKGDIVDGATHKVEFVLNASTDLSVVGDTYASEMTVTSGDLNAAGEGDIITIAGAELNVAYTGVAVDTMSFVKDVSFGTLTFSTGNSDAKITSLILHIDETEASGSAGVLDVDNFELIEVGTGSSYSGTESTGADDTDTTETWTFTDEIYLTKGVARTFTMRGDIPASVATNDSYKVTMATVSESFIVAETVPAGEAITSFSVGAITGKEVTVKTPYLTFETVSMNSTNAVVNQKDVIIFKGIVKASAGTVNISRIRFEGVTAAGGATASTSRFDSDNWSDVGLYSVNSAGGYTLLQNITYSGLTTGYADFNALNLAVVPGSPVTFVVKGTVDAVLDTDTSCRTVHVQIDAITAKDTDGNAATPYLTNASTEITDAAPLEQTPTFQLVTLGSEGVLYVQLRNADAGFNKDRIVLAGEGFWAAKIRLRADYEPVKIRDLKFTNDTEDTEDTVKNVCIYSEQVVDASKLLGCATMDSSDIIFFDDINHVVPVGTKDVFVYVTTYNIGNAAGATADSGDRIHLRIASTTGHLTARGEASGEDLAWGDVDDTAEAGEIVFDVDMDNTFDEVADVAGTVVSKSFYVYGSKISNVQLVSSYGGTSVDTVINGTGDYNLAILAITNAANSNTDANGNALKLGVERLSFDVTKHTSTTLSAMAIKRIGGADGWKTMTGISTIDEDNETTGSSTLITVTTTMSTDAFIDAGTTAYYVLRASIDLLGSATGAVNWISASLNDVKGGHVSVISDVDNNIDWSDGYTAAANYAAATIIDSIFLDVDSITGTKVTEAAGSH